MKQLEAKYLKKSGYKLSYRCTTCGTKCTLRQGRKIEDYYIYIHDDNGDFSRIMKKIRDKYRELHPTIDFFGERLFRHPKSVESYQEIDNVIAEALDDDDYYYIIRSVFYHSLDSNEPKRVKISKRDRKFAENILGASMSEKLQTHLETKTVKHDDTEND